LNETWQKEKQTQKKLELKIKKTFSSLTIAQSRRQEATPI